MALAPPAGDHGAGRRVRLIKAWSGKVRTLRANHACAF